MLKNNSLENNNISVTRLLIFIAIAFVISNIFRFNIFHLNEILEKNSKWSYLLTHSILEGSGIFIAGILGIYMLKKQRKVGISFFGTSKSKSLLMAAIPSILLITIGVKNKYGVNDHLFGVIAAIGTFIYCIMEEYGWRGYLQEELHFLKPILKFFLIGFIWYSWHLSFLETTNLGSNIFFLATMIFGSWGIGKVTELTNSILACSCFHFIINIMMFNPFFNNAFVGNTKLIILIVSVLLWILILIKWGNDIKKIKVKNS